MLLEFQTDAGEFGTAYRATNQKRQDHITKKPAYEVP